MRTLTINGRTFTVVSPTPIASVILPSSAWIGEASPYSQVVSVPGTTKNSQVNLTPTVEQNAIFSEKHITFTSKNEGGAVTIYVFGQKPTNDYIIPADLVEVENAGPVIYGITIATPLNPDKFPSDTVTDEQIAEAVNKYLEENPIGGVPGKDGISATHSWNGTVLTVTSASGTSSADLKGDKGDKGDSVKGDPGEDGDDGVSPTVAVSKSGKVTTINITDKDGTKTATINDGTDGDPGKDGVTPAFSIGTVSTLEAGSNATASITGTAANPVLNLGIPKGDPGEGGNGGSASATAVEKIVEYTVDATAATATSFTFTVADYPKLAEYNHLRGICKKAVNGSMPWVQVSLNSVAMHNQSTIGKAAGSNMGMVGFEITRNAEFYLGGLTALTNTSSYNAWANDNQFIPISYRRFLPLRLDELTQISVMSYQAFLDEGATIEIWGWND